MKGAGLIAVLIGLTAFALSLAPAVGHNVENPAKNVSRSLSVSGEVKKPLQLSVADVKALPSRTVKDVAIISKHGTTMIKSLKGVLLKDILDKAEIAAKQPGDTKRMFIVATATDNYKAVFSWNELFNSPLSEGILVAYEKDGAELADAEGKLLLVSTKDFMTGSRHVKWLKSVDVRKIND
jgi:DMSO/TMAO reductase YedYZ molybdopterin-dependent catalytic subunit